MSGTLGKLTTQRFLREYWQKRPCLLRQALPDFEPPLDGDDIAGLACEETAESRLVSGNFPQHNWRLLHGPFDPELFADLPDKQWTLLVQDVEKHYPPLQSLLNRFDFLPSWRIDDLMVSYAAPGGSVGPHVDQYDVFLYQAQGQRLWQVAERFEPELLEGCPLNVLRRFEPEQEWLLKPGDMLYLPPNVAHHGIAIDECMTWSIGARAPSTADLLVSLGEKLSERGGGKRYTDPDLEASARPGEIDAAAMERLQSLVSGALGDPEKAALFLGEFLTRFRLAREPRALAPPIDAAELLQHLQSGRRLIRNPWTRLAWMECGDHARLFAAGSTTECSMSIAMELCGNPEPRLFSGIVDESDINAVVALVNGGHLHIEED